MIYFICIFKTDLWYFYTYSKIIDVFETNITTTTTRKQYNAVFSVLCCNYLAIASIVIFCSIIVLGIMRSKEEFINMHRNV